jgi:hypothetical protein
MKLKKIFYFIVFISGAGILGFCLGRLQPSINSSSNNSSIKLYNQYKIINIDPNCPIKGNASKTNKIYHLPGGQFYDRITKPEKCFQTEKEALEAGFKKSGR